MGLIHKVLTYIEYRAVSGVFRTTVLTPHPLSAQRVCTPPHQRRGGTNSPGGEGVVVNSSEDARHWIGLLQYNPSTVLSFYAVPALLVVRMRVERRDQDSLLLPFLSQEIHLLSKDKLFASSHFK
jgi:hypothetical protein